MRFLTSEKDRSLFLLTAGARVFVYFAILLAILYAKSRFEEGDPEISDKRLRTTATS